MKWLNALMAVLFVLFAAVQINDPDALVWMAVYICGAAVCIAYFTGRMLLVPPIVIAAVTLIWAGYLAPQVIGAVSFEDLFQDIGMKTKAVEHGRELGGLLILGTWMLVLAAYRASRR